MEMVQTDYQFSRKNRITYFLTNIVDWETAFKIYDLLDELPDKVLEIMDDAVYDELVHEGVIKELRRNGG